MTVTGGNPSDSQPVVTEETDVSKIPYPEGTAPPELDDAVHAHFQYTMTNAIVKTLIDGGSITPEYAARARSMTATELLSKAMEQEYASLSEALGDVFSNAFYSSGGSAVDVASSLGIGLTETDDDGQRILKYNGPLNGLKYAEFDGRIFPVYSFTVTMPAGPMQLTETYYLVVTSTGGDAYAFKKSSGDQVGILVTAEFHKYFDANTTIPANGCAYVQSSSGIVGTIAGDGNIDVTDTAISVPYGSVFRSTVNMNVHASSIVVHKSWTDCYIRNTSSSAVTKNAGTDMANGKLMPDYLYD